MKPKAYRVTFINFDFSGVDDVTQEEMDEAVDEALSNVWYADDEDDLVDAHKLMQAIGVFIYPCV